MRHVLSGFLFAVALAWTPAVATDAPAIPLECAVRDMQLITEIEQRGEAQTVTSEALYAAFLNMMKARTACLEGRQRDAIALYDGAFGPTLAQHPQQSQQ